MSKDQKLATFEAALARQDEELRAFQATLVGLGDVELRVPTRALEDLDEATKISLTNLATPHFGVRG